MEDFGASVVPLIRIGAFDELDQVLRKLHDCEFDLDEAAFNTADGTWSAVFFRPLWGHPDTTTIRSKLVFAKHRLPVAKASLRLSQVTDVKVLDNAEIGTYTLYGIEPISGGIRFHFNELLDIDLRLPHGVDATYEEELMVGHHAEYGQYFLFIESGPYTRPNEELN